MTGDGQDTMPGATHAMPLSWAIREVRATIVTAEWLSAGQVCLAGDNPRAASRSRRLILRPRETPYAPFVMNSAYTLPGHCKNLAKIPNLFCVSSVDTAKKVQLLDEHRGKLAASSPDAPKLNIHIQVNTSGEESKSGCPPGPETVSLARVVEQAPNLHLLGLMTIGAIARSVATTPENENEDFVSLKEQRDLVVKELGLERELELSMGMSEDFEGAIAMGSSEVRVGSTIFGTRGPKSEAKITV